MTSAGDVLCLAAHLSLFQSHVFLLMSGSFGQTNDGKEPERNLQPAAARRFKTKATEKNKQRRPTKTTTIGCFVNLCHFWPLTLSERELNANIVALSAKRFAPSTPHDSTLNGMRRQQKKLLSATLRQTLGGHILKTFSKLSFCHKPMRFWPTPL